MAGQPQSVDSRHIVIDTHQFAAALGEGAGDGAGHAAAAVSVIPRALTVVGFLTSGMGAATAVHKQPSGVLAAHKLAYHIGLGAVFAAGVADVCAARWVVGDVRARRHAGKGILCAASILLLVAIGLGGYDLHLK